MQLKEDGILIQMTEDERKDVSAAYEEMLFHINNLLLELGAVKDNLLRTRMYCDALNVISRQYSNALYLAVHDNPQGLYRKPGFREEVEAWIRTLYEIDHFADILPKGKVKAVANGNGSFLMEVRP